MRRLLSCTMSLFCFSVMAADYHWTGNAHDGKWSTAGNWADSSGTAKTAAPVSGTVYSYDFSSHGNGETISQDVASVIASSITVGTGSLTISSAQNCKFAFVNGTGEVPVTLNGGAILTLGMDVSSDTNTKGINLLGTGTVVLDWPSPCGGERKINLNSAGITLRLANAMAARNAFVALNVRAKLELDCDAYIKDLFYEWGDSNHLGSSIALNGHALTVGVGYDQWNARESKNVYVGLGGTVRISGQAVETFANAPAGGMLAVTASKLMFPSALPGTFALGASGDEDAPLRNISGAGLGLVAPVGMPAIVADATRGNVLSFDGTKYLKGAGADGAIGVLSTGNKAQMTLAFWMKPASDCNGNARMFFWGDAELDRCFGLQQLRNSGSKFGVTFNTSTGADANHRLMWAGGTGINLADGAWHHVAVVYNGTSTVVYIDGQVAMTNGNSNGSNPTIADKGFVIGAIPSDITDVFNGSANYKGLLDDILIMRQALTADEVSDLKVRGAATYARSVSLAVDGPGSINIAGDSLCIRSMEGMGVDGGITTSASRISVGGNAVAADSGSYSARLTSTAAMPATLIKEGNDYDLTLDGMVSNIGEVHVKAGSLELKQPVTRKGLVLYYPFDSLETVGDDAGMLGYGLRSIQPSGSAALTMVADGVRGSAVHFAPGATTCLETSDTCSMPAVYPKGNDSFTFSVWVRPDTAAFARSVIFSTGKWSGVGEKKCAMLGFNGASELQFSTESGRDMKVTVPSLDDGKWHHIAAVYDAARQQKRLYLDGALKEEKSIPAMDLADRRLTIGRFESHAPDYFDVYSGDMDELMVLNRAWTDADVTAEYSLVLPAAADASTVLPKPIAHWTFDDAMNPGKDSSGNGCDLTVQGTASVVDDINVDGKALSLTGSGYLKFASGMVPSVFPQGDNSQRGPSYTVVCRYRPSYTSGTPNQCVMAWGNSSDMGHINGGVAVRCQGKLAHVTACGKTFEASDEFRRTHSATDEQGWTTVVVVYDSLSYDGADSKRMIRWYLNGELQASEPKGWVNRTATDFYIGSYNNAYNFRGLIDDVAIYDRALSDNEARIVTRTLSAHNGGLAPMCFAAAPDVTVAAGAMLKVSTSEPVRSLSGSGTVIVDRLATFTPMNISGFTGTVAGLGTFGYPAGYTFAVPDTATCLPIVSSPGTIALGANTAFDVANTISGTFTLLHADGGILCEDIESLVVTGTAAALRARLQLANGNKDLVLRVPTGFILIVR